MVSDFAKSAPKPIRWFSAPQLFRYEKQQRGRLREHFQLNCDIVGEAGPRADAEVIALAIDICRELGLTASDFRVRLSDRRVMLGLLAMHNLGDAEMSRAFGAIDKLERAGEAATRAVLAEAGLAPERIDGVLRIAAIRDVATLRTMVAAAGLGDGADPFFALLDALDAMGLADFIEVDFSIVRGLAYYTGTVFELFDRQGKLRAICGGGRYDTLLASVGSIDLPAVGFGLGDVVLGELLKDRGLRPTAPASIDCFIAAIDEADLPSVLALAHRLRDAGVSVEYPLETPVPKLGKQLKLAESRGARLAVVIGPDDRARGEAQLKDLAARTQQAVPYDELVARCRAILTTTD